MNLKWRLFQTFATAIFLCVSASTAFSLQSDSFWTQKKVTSGMFPIHSACMMPPEANLTKIGVKGAGGMSKESDAWAGVLEDLVESKLKADGIALNSAINPLSSGASDDEVRGVIFQVRQKLSAISPLMNKKPKQIAHSAYTLGDEVGMLPCSEKSDVLVFVQGVGQVLTDGREAMTFFVGGPAEGAVVLVTIADAKTGEIVGLIRVYPGDGFLTSAETEIGHRLMYQFGYMNIGSARKNVKALYR